VFPSEEEPLQAPGSMGRLALPTQTPNNSDVPATLQHPPAEVGLLFDILVLTASDNRLADAEDVAQVKYSRDRRGRPASVEAGRPG
jgi:hypothetical protein